MDLSSFDGVLGLRSPSALSLPTPRLRVALKAANDEGDEARLGDARLTGHELANPPGLLVDSPANETKARRRSRADRVHAPSFQFIRMGGRVAFVRGQD